MDEYDARDVEVMLCRRIDSSAIPSDMVKEVKKRMYEVLKEHKGETHEGDVFVRRISSSEARRAVPGRCVVPKLEEKVLFKISLTGKHDSSLLRLVTQRLYELSLDVAACEMFGGLEGQEDYAVFYATFKPDTSYGDVWLFRNKVQSSLHSLVQAKDPGANVFSELVPDVGGKKHQAARRRAGSLSSAGSAISLHQLPDLGEQGRPAPPQEEPSTLAVQARKVALGMTTNLPHRRLQLSGLSPAFSAYHPSHRGLHRRAIIDGGQHRRAEDAASVTSSQPDRGGSVDRLSQPTPPNERASTTQTAPINGNEYGPKILSHHV